MLTMEVRVDDGQGLADAAEIVTAKLREKRATTDRRPPDDVIEEIVSGGRAAGALDALANLVAHWLPEVAESRGYPNVELALRDFTTLIG
jgi:hypothetical protein